MTAYLLVIVVLIYFSICFDTDRLSDTTDFKIMILRPVSPATYFRLLKVDCLLFIVFANHHIRHWINKFIISLGVHWINHNKPNRFVFPAVCGCVSECLRQSLPDNGFSAMELLPLPAPSCGLIRGQWRRPFSVANCRQGDLYRRSSANCVLFIHFRTVQNDNQHFQSLSSPVVVYITGWLWRTRTYCEYTHGRWNLKFCCYYI